MSKKILFIHGLASKPKKEVLLQNWQRCLDKNLQLFDEKDISIADKSEMVYWANDIPNHLEDDDEYCKKVSAQIDKPLKERVKLGNEFHVGLDDKFKDFFKDKKVSLFVTMGSPLGDKVIQDMLFAQNHNDERRYISNIKTWLNFSALGDIVSHDSTLKDDFMKNMQDIGLLDEKSKDYVKLYNPFITPKNKSNPHKSYGYLLQPKLAEKLSEFLKN